MTAARKLTRKEDQHDQHQDHAANQIGFDRIGGQMDQFAAVVKRKNLHVRRENIADSVLRSWPRRLSGHFASARRGSIRMTPSTASSFF